MVYILAEEKSPHWKEFGKWLYDRRRIAEKTQKEAAKAAGLAWIQWWRLEHGESGTKYDTVPRLAAAVGAPLAETYRRAGFAPPAQLEDVPEIIRFEVELPELSDEDKAKVEEYAAMLADKARRERVPS